MTGRFQLRVPKMEGLDEVGAALRKCPFLHSVSASQGEGFARQLAVAPVQRPAAAAAAGASLVFPEDSSFMETAMKLFHGPGGVVPLQRFAEDAGPKRCPYAAAAQQMLPPAVDALAGAPLSAGPAQQRGVAAPMAAISLGGFGSLPDPLDFLFGKASKAKRQQAKQKRPRPGGKGAAKGAQPGPAAVSQAAQQPAGGQCPLRKFAGPLGGLLPLGAAVGRLGCPPAIVKMRAAVAALKPVRDLRPQALPVRALALGAAAVAANFPCGAWREHTRKFSFQWFLAVHATIPFVAMLRKAVLMPPWAIALTVASAVAGQQAGAALERSRLAGDWPKEATAALVGCREAAAAPWASLRGVGRVAA